MMPGGHLAVTRTGNHLASRSFRASTNSAPRQDQRAPFNVHDVEQVVVVPRSHLMQTATH
jgi:hypothetical protein